MKIIHIYSQRWRVEEYHNAWKTGAGAERQRMAKPENLERKPFYLQSLMCLLFAS